MNKYNSASNTFFSGMFDQFDDIAQGNKVCIVGKDPYKGQYGIVMKTYNNQHNEHIFTIQLQTTGATIDRKKKNVKRHYD